jgi:ATP-dependent protease Clp ATPase subunit
VRSILENLVTDVLYEMPSREEKGTYVVTSEMVRREGEIGFTPFATKGRTSPAGAKDAASDKKRDIA